MNISVFCFNLRGFVNSLSLKHIFLSTNRAHDIGYIEASPQVRFVAQNVFFIVYNLLSSRTIDLVHVLYAL